MITRELYLFDKNGKRLSIKKVKTKRGNIGIKQFAKVFENKKVDVIRVPKNFRMDEISRKNFENRNK